jgi:dipeptidyl aminopeptidase/acylaminoacyl peptidase
MTSARHFDARLPSLALLLALTLAAPVARGDGPAAATPASTPPAAGAPDWRPFINTPVYDKVSLSPKGTYLAIIALAGQQRTLRFVRLSDGKVTSQIAPGPSGMVGDFWWVSDEKVVARLIELSASVGGAVNYGDLLAVDAARGTYELIFGFRAGRQQVGSHIRRAEPEEAWATVVDTLRKDDRRIVVSIRRWDDVGDRRVRLAKLDVENGMKTELGQSPLPNAQYLTDEDGEPRIAWATGEDAKLHLLFRDDGRAWQPLESLPGVGPGTRPWSFRAADRTLLVVDPAEGGFALSTIAVDTGARVELARTRISPPTALLTDRDTGKVLAVESAPDLPDWQILDEAHPLSQVLAGLLDANPGRHVEIVNRTSDQRLALVHVYGDRDPGRWLLVDVAKRSAEQILVARPWIDPERMAETSAFHIKASDGLLIHGYLTLPRGLPAGQKAPGVVLLHGGPFGHRDEWGFDEEVQLLASQGYAVLQVNFRGSGGYGDAFQEAGFRHWGDRMIEDVADATRWAVRKGRVDGGRICAYGTSFGGYAAVQATAVAPELFRCAIGVAGPYDLTRLEKNDDIVTFKTSRAFIRAATGEDRGLLEAASPLFHADRLRAPLLLIHGGKDTRVPIVHAEKLRDALTALGRPPAWLEEPLEGHGFIGGEARARQAARVLQFLGIHTAPAPAAPAAPTAAPPAPAAP